MSIHLQYLYSSEMIWLMKSFFRIIALFAFFPLFALAQSGKVAQVFYQKKTENFLLKDKSLVAYYTIDTTGVTIYETPENKEKHIPEFYASYSDIERWQGLFKFCSPDTLVLYYKKGGLGEVSSIFKSGDIIRLSDTLKKMNGLKIAIDPGHIAGNMEMGEIEKKCLNMRYAASDGQLDSIAFSEGELTFATAQLLKNKLETYGANVMLTRPYNNACAFGNTFEQWLKTDYVKTVDSLFNVGKITAEQKQFFMSSKASKRDKFRVIFKDVELARRAELINAFHPDITVIIHYNVDENNTGWKKPTQKNFNMTFVGGAFMQNDLSSPEKRLAFFRLLITNDIEQSVALSGAVINSFEKTLGVKTATVNDAVYLKEGCLTTNEQGVYCRNLQLTRIVYGVLVYGETLYQDNVNECVQLNKELDKMQNQRVQKVAEAYFQGIMEYIKE